MNFSEHDGDLLLNKCQVAVFILDDISEAFQFFDSQNARGRDLEPHDLLKAYHLREFSVQEEHLQAGAVAHWESLASNDLATLFQTTFSAFVSGQEENLRGISIKIMCIFLKVLPLDK